MRSFAGYTLFFVVIWMFTGRGFIFSAQLHASDDLEADSSELEERTEDEQTAQDEQKQNEISWSVVYGTLLVTSSPPGQEVFIDNTSVGLTPMKKKIKGGSYLVSIESPCFISKQKEVTLIDAGSEESVAFDLEPRMARLRVEITDNDYDEAEGSVVVDDEELGSFSEITDLPLCTKSVLLITNKKQELRIPVSLSETTVVTIIKSLLEFPSLDDSSLDDSSLDEDDSEEFNEEELSVDTSPSRQYEREYYPKEKKINTGRKDPHWLFGLNIGYGAVDSGGDVFERQGIAFGLHGVLPIARYFAIDFHLDMLSIPSTKYFDVLFGAGAKLVRPSDVIEPFLSVGIGILGAGDTWNSPTHYDDDEGEEVTNIKGAIFVTAGMDFFTKSILSIGISAKYTYIVDYFVTHRFAFTLRLNLGSSPES